MSGLLTRWESSGNIAQFVLYDCFFFFFQAEDGIRDVAVTGVQTCALPISNNTRVSDGTLIPHFSAIATALRPTSAGFGSRCGVTSTLASASISSLFRKYPPWLSNSRFTSDAIGSSTTTEFSDEQRTPLSNVLP